MSIAAPIDRNLIEQIVREIVLAQVGGPPGKPNLVVSVSARHCHLTDEDTETLFGKGHKLTVQKDLYQDGFFAAEETVMLVGPKRRMLPTVRVLGPHAAGNAGRTGLHRRHLAGHRPAGAAQRQRQGHAGLRARRPQGRGRIETRRDPRRAARPHGSRGCRLLRRQATATS